VRYVRYALLGSALVLPVACATEDTAREASRQRTEDGLASMVQPECDDTNMCKAGFFVDGDFYSQSCAAVRPDLVTGRAVARGRYGETATVELRAVRGVEPDVLAAISIPGGACDDGEIATSPWSMAFGPGANDEWALHSAICEAVPGDQRGRNGCD
jgi:hypothetical protein